MATIRQRCRQLDLPGSLCADLGGANQIRAAVEQDGGVGNAGAAHQRRVVIGGLPVVDGAGIRTHVVHHVGDRRNGRRRGVRSDDLAFRAGVPGPVGCRYRQQFPILFWRGEGKGEVAGLVNDPGANHRVSIAHGDGAARFALAGEGIAVVEHGEAARRARGDSVNGDRRDR